MQIDHLVWDDWNVAHIAEHDVEPEEVESVCHTEQHLARRAGITRYSLARYHLYGQTENGRYLFIVLDREVASSFYVVTARDMDESEKRSFKRMRGKR
jgi:uncharacterized DUF497 family protein